ncbi:MAG: lipid II flippase MurJ, partial [Pseudomonadota bacterium]
DFRPSHKTLWRCVMIVVSSAAMGLALYLCLSWGSNLFQASGILVRILLLALAILISMAVYFPLAIATDAIDRQALMGAVRRRAP